MKQYEIYVKSGEGDFQFNSWISIPTELLNLQNIDYYIDLGIIREAVMFDCQREIEGESICDSQCDHCNKYYSGRGDSLTSIDALNLSLLKWLAKEDLLGDSVDVVWSKIIGDNPT